MRAVNRFPTWMAGLSLLLGLAGRAAAQDGAGVAATLTDLYGDPLPPGAVARLGTVRLRHNSYFATATVLTPDGKTILTAAPDSDALHYWRAEDGKLLRTVTDKEPVFGSLSLSADGKVLASGGSVRVGPRDFQGRLRLWDVAAGRVLHALSYPGAAPGDVALCPDGKTVITADSDGALRAWDVPAGKEVRQLQLAEGRDFLALALSADGSLVAATQKDNQGIYLWAWRTTATARKFKLPPSDYANPSATCLAFSPDGKTLAAAGYFRPGVSLWDVAHRRLLRTISTGDSHADFVHTVQFSGDGKWLASAGGDAVRNVAVLWDPATGKQLRQWEFGPEMAKHISFSADGRLLAVAAGGGVRLWRTDTGKAVAECRQAHRSLIWALAVSSRGAVIASASRDGTVRLWEAATGKQRGVFRHGGSVQAVTFSPDGRLLATSATDDAVRLWDVATGREIYKLAGHGRHGGGPALCFRPDGKALVSWGDDLYLRVWDVAKGKALVEHRPHPAGLSPRDEEEPFPGGVVGAALTADSQVCVLADSSKLHAFDVTTGKKRRSLPAGTDMRHPVVSPDGRRVLVHDRGPLHSLSVWDLDSGKLLRKLSPGGRWAEVAFSPDGRMVAVAGGVPDRQVELWELATGQRRLTIAGVSAGHAVAFSPDGRLLVTGMMDTTALVWELKRFRK
jgi:WD40 repeat protein